MSRIIVGGFFDNTNGRPSKIVKTIADNLGYEYLNGGNIADLGNINSKNYDVVIWMADLDNSQSKILPLLKKNNPKLLLVSSKNVYQDKYNHLDSSQKSFVVVSHLLKNRCNLGIKIDRNKQGRYIFSVLDPLGNRYGDVTEDITDICSSIESRVLEIKDMNRIPSKKVGEVNNVSISATFLKHVINLGDGFSKHVNAINPERFLGNASTRLQDFNEKDRSTRCCHGFPSFREGEKYFISRRNVDKQTLAGKDFVAVASNEATVEYYGDIKPSVDSPIQIRLFNYYSDVNYMVHGHVYVENAPITKSNIPCGHIEEFDEITELFPERNSSNFIVNLKGHGCLILAHDLDFFNKVTLKSRPFPEPR